MLLHYIEGINEKTVLGKSSHVNLNSSEIISNSIKYELNNTTTNDT